MPMLSSEIMRHVFRPFLLCLTVMTTMLAAQEPVKSCLREFPSLYTLETGFSPQETPADRVSRTHSLLASKFKMTPDAVARNLPPLAEKLREDKKASKLDRACAQFVGAFFTEAKTLALEAGDAAHRAEPRLPAEVISALRLAAFAAMELGQHEEGIRILGVALGETSSDRDLPTWTQLQTATARAYAGLKMLKNEEQTLRHIYTEHERLLGARHADTVRHHSALAGTLYQHGHDMDAERETRAVLKSTLQLYGEKHDQTQVVRKNLARVLEALGRHAEAEMLRREVLAAQMEVHGGGAAGTLRSREQLVKNLSDQKKYAEAETEARILVQHGDRANGADAVTTLAGRTSLALAIQQQGRHEESLKMLQALEADCIRVLGLEHVDTLHVQHSLGTCLNSLERFAEAENTLTQALEVRRRVLPTDDLATIDTGHQLGIALLRQGKFREALTEIRIASLTYERLVRSDDPRLAAVNKTADEFSQLEGGKKFLIAEQRETMEKAQRKLAPDSIESLSLRSSLAAFIARLGEAKESLEEYQAVYAGCLRTLGEDQQGTVDILEKIGRTQIALGMFTEGEKSMRKVLESRARHLPKNDPKIEEARFNLGLCLGQMGKLAEAGELVEASYLAVKDRTDLNPAFVQGMKQVLDQIQQLSSARSTPQEAPQPIQSSAPATINQSPSITGSAIQTMPSANAPINMIGGPAIDPGTLVPSTTIQRPVEFKP
jgi:tetratricopeptide (TPR) repeat protein